VKCGEGQKALEHFQQMQQGVQPDPVTFVVVLNACASLQALEEGNHNHEQIIQSSCKSDAFVISSLVDIYAKVGIWRMLAKCLIRSCCMMWSLGMLIFGYMKCGQGQKALELF